MRLWLSEAQARAIVEQAVAGAPQEICGLIGGRGEQAVMVVPITNAAADPAHFFRLDDAAFIRTMKLFNDQGLALIGIYHSHPRGEAIPSPVDIQQAAYPDAAYLIVGLAGEVPGLNAWQIERGRVEPVDLFVGIIPPSLTAEKRGVSLAERNAIILSAVIAVVVMLILSLSLLPPAPIIPSP